MTDQIEAWYRPYLVQLPAGTFRPGTNEIRITAVSDESVGIGRVLVGPATVLRDRYIESFFWQITAPLCANFAMLVLGALSFLLWIGRRQERELLWLSVSTALWFLRNYQYFAGAPPFWPVLFNALAVYATYFGTVATFAFYASYTHLGYRRPAIAALLVLGVPLVIANNLFGASNLVFYVPTSGIAIALAVLGFTHVRRHPDIERGVIALAMMTMPFTSLYDMSVAGGSRGWNGSYVYTAVFGGFVYSLAFLISFGKRAVDAFGRLALANVELEQRIAETRAELAASEAAREELAVAHAVAGERGRLMQEMHDGIGSNLITALAVARQQNQPASTIKTLRRALADLKITVDSLEPVEGDLVALIGNLRHRMAADLRDAGIACKWQVEPCGPLPWLDAANALHVLRIFQEAIGNVLAHSEASEMRIGCREQAHDGIAGVIAYVADNGRGFAGATGPLPGKGLANMAARACSLHGVLGHESTVGQGTVISLWLPYRRVAAAPSAKRPAAPPALAMQLASVSLTTGQQGMGHDEKHQL